MLEDDTSIINQQDILIPVRQYYADLYEEKKRAISLSDAMSSLDTSGLKLVPPSISEEIDEPLTYNEVAKAVNKLKNQKSPGPDGYPAEFYKVFWHQIGYLYFRAIQENFLNGCLSTSQQQGVITCIPKGNKPRKFF